MKLIYRLMIILAYLISTLCVVVLTSQGYFLTWLYKRVGWPSELNAINCWPFVIAKWLEQGPSKTYIIGRMSWEGAPVLHGFFAKSIAGLEVEELKPLNKPRPGWRRFFHAFWHKSRVRKGKGEE